MAGLIRRMQRRAARRLPAPAVRALGGGRFDVALPIPPDLDPADARALVEAFIAGMQRDGIAVELHGDGAVCRCGCGAG